ncbi:hypothetical protein B0H66DRAFT_544685 [Apodospora peruviana]|uniref:Znf1 n=1 Tax=Apodospora peruviana TaxID=516989 RepID=A0AAE0ITK2_9PEZI|nr:hypothetical protein B0H66DRAFT_544685 [Apodospora peruviana]
MGAETEHRTTPATTSWPASPAKRKAPTTMDTVYSGYGRPVVHIDLSQVEYVTPSKKVRKEKSQEEKRLRRFRPQPPQAFQEIYNRATSQRFYVLSRRRYGTSQLPEEVVEVTGSTGNIYTVMISRQPSCDCPMGSEGKQCKHIVYVLARVLRAKYEYVYQLALLSTELQDIFADAPPPMEDDDGGVGSSTGGGNKNRKPVEGDCPICFSDMESQGNEVIVWCRAACGQNIHKECFEMWAATKRQQASGGNVTCPYCRSVWDGDEDMAKKIKRTGDRNQEGYMNVAEQLGISQVRDTSTYSRWWTGHPHSFRRRYD